MVDNVIASYCSETQGEAKKSNMVSDLTMATVRLPRFFDTVIRKIKKSALLLCLLVHLVGGIVYSVQAPFFYPAYAQTRDITLMKYSTVFFVYELLILSLYPLVGALLTNTRAHICVTAGLFCLSYSCVGFGYLSITEDPTLFLILSLAIRGLEALGSCAYTVGVLHVVCSTFPSCIRIVLSSLNIAFACGIGIGTVFAYLSSALTLLDESFVFLGGLLFVFGAIGYFIIPENIGGHEIQDIAEIVTENKDDSGNLTPCAKTIHFFKLPGVWAGICSTIVGMISLSFLRCTRDNMIDNLALSSTYASLLSILCPMTNIIATLCWLCPIDKGVSPRLCIIMGAAILSIGILLIGPICYMVDPSLIPYLFALGQILVGSGSPPVLTAAFTDLVTNSEKGKLPGVEDTYQTVVLSWKSAYSIGNYLGPLAGYILLEYFKFSVASFFIFILNIGLIIVIAYLVHVSKKRPVKQIMYVDPQIGQINYFYEKASHFVQPQSNVIFFPSQPVSISQLRCPSCTSKCIQVANDNGKIHKRKPSLTFHIVVSDY